MKSKILGKGVYLVFTALLLAVLMFVLAMFTHGIKSNQNLDGALQLQKNIQDAVVLCYATEGFYPPSLEYIESNYSIFIDNAKYSVWYEIFAQNVPPVIKVVER